MAHTYSHVYLHTIFSTFRREPLLADGLGPRVHAYMATVLRNLGCRVVVINGMPNHVHLLFRMAPELALSDLVRDIKANSSGWIHRTVPFLRDFAWQAGYGVFSVSGSGVARVKEYIVNQQEHHRARTFAEEFAELLRLHRELGF